MAEAETGLLRPGPELRDRVLRAALAEQGHVQAADQTAQVGGLLVEHLVVDDEGAAGGQHLEGPVHQVLALLGRPVVQDVPEDDDVRRGQGVGEEVPGVEGHAAGGAPLGHQLVEERLGLREIHDVAFEMRVGQDEFRRHIAPGPARVHERAVPRPVDPRGQLRCHHGVVGVHVAEERPGRDRVGVEALHGVEAHLRLGRAVAQGLGELAPGVVVPLGGGLHPPAEEQLSAGDEHLPGHGAVGVGLPVAHEQPLRDERVEEVLDEPRVQAAPGADLRRAARALGEQFEHADLHRAVQDPRLRVGGVQPGDVSGVGHHGYSFRRRAPAWPPPFEVPWSGVEEGPGSETGNRRSVESAARGCVP